MKKAKNIEIWVVFIIYTLVCTCLFYFQRKITGPAIFGDEAEYFNLIRMIHEQGEFNSRQYNVLYPFIMSFTFFSNKLTLTYDIIKVLNVLLFSSGVIPAYLISKKLTNNQMLSYGFAFVIGLLPCCTTSLIIWAEPLFYPLSLWGGLVFFDFINNKSVSNMIKLALICFLLYLTKQSGIVFVIAVEMTLIYDYFINDKKKLKIYIISLAMNVVPIILQMLWNKLKGQEAMGYSSEIKSYSVLFSNPWAFIKLFFYQCSDVILMSYFIFAVIFIAAIFQIKKEKKLEQSQYIMVALWSIGIILLSALHRVPQYVESTSDTASLIYSRYTCVVIPFILIFGIKQIMEHRIEKKWMIGISVPAAIICIAFSPISSALYAYGHISNFGLSYMNTIVNGYNKVLYARQEVASIYIIGQIVCFIIIGLLILSKNKTFRIIGLTIFAAFSIFAGMEAARLGYRVCRWQNGINEMYRFLIDSGIDRDNFVIDSQFENSNLPHLNYMWYGVKEINNDQEEVQYLVTQQEYSYELVFINDGGYRVYKIR